MKTMNTKYMTEKDKKSAECEVEFLRVVTGPTIIKFYESFVEELDIFIVMEYAEGGSLAQLIQKHVLTGKKFTEDELKYSNLKLQVVSYTEGGGASFGFLMLLFFNATWLYI